MWQKPLKYIKEKLENSILVKEPYKVNHLFELH